MTEAMVGRSCPFFDNSSSSKRRENGIYSYKLGTKPSQELCKSLMRHLRPLGKRYVASTCRLSVTQSHARILETEIARLINSLGLLTERVLLFSIIRLVKEKKTLNT